MPPVVNGMGSMQKASLLWVALACLGCADSGSAQTGTDGGPGTGPGSTDPASTDPGGTDGAGTDGGGSGGAGSSGGGATATTGSTTQPPSCPPTAADEIYDDPLTHLGRAESDTFIEILDVVARDPLVYSCTGTQGLTIWDATNPASARLVSENTGPAGLSHPTFPRCQHVALNSAGTRAVLTNRGDEIQPTPWLFLYDVSDPDAPRALRGWQGTDFTGGTAHIEGVVMDGTRIYAASHTAGILVFDDPGMGSDLVWVGHYQDADSNAWQPSKVGDVLYVAEGSAGLRTYDVSGDDPVLLGAVDLAGSSKDVIVIGTVAYTANSSTVAAIDVTDPAAPAILSEIETEGTALTVAMGEADTLMVAEWNEIRGYNVADPTAPAPVLSEAVPSSDDFSRVLALDTQPASGLVFAGEWTGMQAFQQQVDANGPEVGATPGSIQFGTVEPGDFQDRVMVVRNGGDRPLKIFETGATRDQVSVTPACGEVPVGGALAFEVRFTSDSTAPLAGHVGLRTDDPDEEEFLVEFSANVAGRDVGDPVPPFSLTDLEGTTWSTADLEGEVVVLAYFATF